MIFHPIGKAMFLPMADLSLILPPTWGMVGEIAPAEMRNILAVPPKLLSAKVGIALIPVYLAMYKEAGQAYTQGGDVTIGHVGAVESFAVIQAAGFFDDPAEQLYIAPRPPMPGYNVKKSGFVGKDLVLTCPKNFVGGTGRFFVTFGWREYAIKPVGIDTSVPVP